MDEKKLTYFPAKLEIVNILYAEIITTSDPYTEDSGGWT